MTSMYIMARQRRRQLKGTTGLSKSCRMRVPKEVLSHPATVRRVRQPKGTVGLVKNCRMCWRGTSVHGATALRVRVSKEVLSRTVTVGSNQRWRIRHPKGTVGLSESCRMHLRWALVHGKTASTALLMRRLMCRMRRPNVTTVPSKSCRMYCWWTSL